MTIRLASIHPTQDNACNLERIPIFTEIVNYSQYYLESKDDDEEESISSEKNSVLLKSPAIANKRYDEDEGSDSYQNISRVV